jgi:hypothetical protein
MKYWQVWLQQEEDWFNESGSLYNIEQLHDWINEYYNEGLKLNYSEEELRERIKIKQFEVIESEPAFNIIPPQKAAVAFI